MAYADRERFPAFMIGLGTIELSGDIDQLKDFVIELREATNGCDLPKGLSDALFAIESSYQIKYELDENNFDVVPDPLRRIADAKGKDDKTYKYFLVHSQTPNKKIKTYETSIDGLVDGLTEIKVTTGFEACRIGSIFKRIVWVLPLEAESLRDVKLDGEFPENEPCSAWVKLSELTEPQA